MVTGQYSRVNERCQISGGGAFALKSRAKQYRVGLDDYMRMEGRIVGHR